jgi:glycosyltransferase involved in cell wall biosynthesis
MLSKLLRLLRRIVRKRLASDIGFVTDSRNWVTFHVGRYISEGLETKYHFEFVTDPGQYRDSLLHFTAQFGYFKNPGAIHPSNRIVANWWHGTYDALLWDSELKRALDNLAFCVERASKVVVTNSKVQRFLIESTGLPEKIVKIPLGVELARFHPPSGAAERQAFRKQFGIPDQAVCIGSFQKDGKGWGEGEIPKLIKGPDVFLAVVSQISEAVPVFVLLTGPARGYVKQGLAQRGIPFRHFFFEDYYEVADCYKAIDLYLITSRDEGGPQGLLESMASGVPVISTSVGMSCDLIQTGETGILVDVDDVDGLTQGALEAIRNGALADRIRTQALQLIEHYDWSQIARLYDQEVYTPLLARKGNAL